MSNKYSDQLMQALDIAIDEKISTLQFDKTIQATVQSVVDLDTGEYRVKYKDGIISAFAADPKETFKQGDAVYVTVPESDFSNKKFISHRITNNSLSTGQYTELANTIFEVSPNFSDLGYIYTSQPSNGYSLVVGENSSLNILQSAPELANSRFKAYADQYEYIQISASFYNEFTTDHEVGDYGIQLVLTNLDDKQVSYFLNLNDFNGDPYHLATWSPQSTVIKIPKGQIKALNAIYFYENGFISEGNKANLFMSDFSLNFVDKVDLTEVPYYLNILPLDGIAFTADQASLRLEGHVYHIGEELPETSCIFQWFERDLSVAPGDEAYDKRAGWGWRPIEGATNKLLTRTKTQVPWQKSYKLVAVYNSTTLMTKEITLINESLDIEIEQVTSGNAIYLKLTKSGYTGDWYYLASDGNQVAIPQSPRSGTSPDIVPYLLYSPMTFYCQVYQGEIYQGELNYVMQNIESKDDVSVVFSGESLFSYDANGDINIYDAELERSLQAEIVWKKGIISSSPTIRWLDFENNVIGSEWVDYSNKDSMLKKVRVDTIENILYYTVKHKFKQTPSKNNSFRIEISTTDGQVYSFDKEIVFTKTGDPGTNGTRYQSLITITSSNRFVGVNSSNTTITLGCKVYKDQTEFSGANITWTPVNLAIVSQSGAAISVKANNNNRERYVKATINITDEGKTTTLYDFFPVDSCASQPVIDISELPKYIQYATNGRNPQFRKQVPVIKYNNATATIASEDTAVIKIANGQFKPIDEFNPDNPVGLLKVTVSGITIYHPVPMYINTFGNEAINGWDGVSVDVDTEGGKILAPQVGAGTKDSANKFTGVVMGKDSAQQKVGLYGYQAGVNSFGLTEEGKAYFGVAGKGRITIDGTQATISGGGGGTSTSGMTITLSAAASSADAIRVGNGNFIVTYGGKLTAKSAVIDGTITAGAGSVIGGWTLAAKRLYSGTGTSYVALDSGTANVNQAIWAGKADPATAPFRVTRAGALTATSADITGAIKATSGYIGGTSGWTIDSNKIYGAKNSKYVALSTQGNYALFAGASSSDDTGGANAPFWVKFDGSLQATAAIIQGKITATEGAIGNWKINSAGDGALRSTLSDSGASTRIYLNGKPTSGGNVIEIRTSASSIVDNQTVATNGQFYVTDQGKMVATNAEIHGTIKSKAGELGGWTINSSGLKKADNIYFYSNGSLNVRDNLVVDTSGNVTVKGAITAKTGYLGWESDNNKGWIITGSRIYSNATNYVALASNGTYAIWAGNSTASSAPFSVTHTGKVIATDIEATGKITANTGKIAGWVISGNKLQVRTSATDTTGSTNLYLNGGPWANGESQYVIYMSASSPSDTGASNTNGRFYVTTGGHMFAQSAEIRGTITSKAGSIGTWNISNRAISTLTNETTAANSTTGMARSGFNGYIQVDGKNYSQTDATNRISNIAFWSGMNYVKEGENYYLQGSETGTFFAVTHGGTLYCRKANIRGTIIADSGTIGGWKITNNRLQNEDGTVYLSANGGLKLGDDFIVSATGALRASGATISGAITAGNNSRIGNWFIMNDRLQTQTGSVYLGTNGFKLGSNFSVNSLGQLSASGATISGNITLGAGSTINWNNVSETGTVPYDEAGEAAAALRSAKSYTNDEINSLDIPVLPGYITQNKITRTTIETPTIISGSVYSSNFYAVNNDTSSYLKVTARGIDFYEYNSTATQYQTQWSLFDNGRSLSLFGIRDTLEFSFESFQINCDILGLPQANQIYISTSGTGVTTLAQYVEDHAGTAVFG